ALDRDGNLIEEEFSGLTARIVQHEIDHLNGILCIFRISALKRDLALRRIRKLQRKGEW
ncbi:MAG: peptide deformylase, partial [Bryobacteraceae bacterium]